MTDARPALGDAVPNTDGLPVAPAGKHREPGGPVVDGDTRADTAVPAAPRRRGGRRKGSPKVPGSGRKPGTPNKVSGTMKQFLGTIFNGPKYRAAFERRMLKNKHLETLAWNTCFGRPPNSEDTPPVNPLLVVLNHGPLGAAGYDPLAGMVPPIQVGAGSTPERRSLVPPDPPLEPAPPDAPMEVRDI